MSFHNNEGVDPIIEYRSMQLTPETIEVVVSSTAQSAEVASCVISNTKDYHEKIILAYDYFKGLMETALLNHATLHSYMERQGLFKNDSLS